MVSGVMHWHFSKYISMVKWARFEFDATKPTTQNIFTSVHYMNTFILRHTGVRFVVELQPLVLPKKAIGNFMKHLFAYLQWIFVAVPAVNKCMRLRILSILNGFLADKQEHYWLSGRFNVDVRTSTQKNTLYLTRHHFNKRSQWNGKLRMSYRLCNAVRWK